MNKEFYKIIIADDNAPHRLAISDSIEENVDFFKSTKFQILDQEEKDKYLIEARGGDEVLEILKEQNDIDFLFLDIMMPIDGFDTLEEIRKNNKDLTIIMLSSSDLEVDYQKSKDLGANGYLTKPFRPENWNRKFKLFNDIFILNKEVSDKDIKKDFVFVKKII